MIVRFEWKHWDKLKKTERNHFISFHNKWFCKKLWQKWVVFYFITDWPKRTVDAVNFLKKKRSSSFCLSAHTLPPPPGPRPRPRPRPRPHTGPGARTDGCDLQSEHRQHNGTRWSSAAGHSSSLAVRVCDKTRCFFWSFDSESFFF